MTQPSGPFGQGGGVSYGNPGYAPTGPYGWSQPASTVQGSASDTAIGDPVDPNQPGFGQIGTTGQGGSYVGPQIGQTPGGSTTLANLYSAAGASDQGRQAATIDAPVGADPRAQAQQQQGLALLRAQANGTAPSAAGIGQSAAIGGGLGAAFAAQRAGNLGAGSALGAANSGAVAAGGQGAMNQAVAGQQGLSQGLGAMGGQAVQQTQQDQAMAIQQSQLQQQQLASNNASQLAMQGLATNTGLAQLQADTSWQLAQQGDAGQVGVQNIQQNAALNANLVGAGAGAGAGLANSLAASYQASQGGTAPATPNADTGMTDAEENAT